MGDTLGLHIGSSLLSDPWAPECSTSEIPLHILFSSKTTSVQWLCTEYKTLYEVKKLRNNRAGLFYSTAQTAWIFLSSIFSCSFAFALFFRKLLHNTVHVPSVVVKNNPVSLIFNPFGPINMYSIKNTSWARTYFLCLPQLIHGLILILMINWTKICSI